MCKIDIGGANQNLLQIRHVAVLFPRFQIGQFISTNCEPITQYGLWQANLLGGCLNFRHNGMVCKQIHAVLTVAVIPAAVILAGWQCAVNSLLYQRTPTSKSYVW